MPPPSGKKARRKFGKRSGDNFAETYDECGGDFGSKIAHRPRL